MKTRIQVVTKAVKMGLISAGFMAVLTFCANAQEAPTSKLKGTIYDAQGSVVVKAKITAVSDSKKKFVTFSNENGEYELVLPFNKYESSRRFKEAIYDISVESPGFTTTAIKSYAFIPSQFGRMQLDIALRLGPASDENHP